MHEKYAYIDTESCKTESELKEYIINRVGTLKQQGFNYKEIKKIIFEDKYFIQSILDSRVIKRLMKLIN